MHKALTYLLLSSWLSRYQLFTYFREKQKANYVSHYQQAMILAFNLSRYYIELEHGSRRQGADLDLDGVMRSFSGNGTIIDVLSSDAARPRFSRVINLLIAWKPEKKRNSAGRFTDRYRNFRRERGADLRYKYATCLSTILEVPVQSGVENFVVNRMFYVLIAAAQVICHVVGVSRQFNVLRI